MWIAMMIMSCRVRLGVYVLKINLNRDTDISLTYGPYVQRSSL